MANEKETGACHAEPEKPRGKTAVDLEEVRRILSEKRGPKYWRSLEELAQTDEFMEMLHREFPRHASEWHEGSSRRDFLSLMGASLALAGLTGCTKQPTERIYPYVIQPEEIVTGEPLFFATAMTLGGVGRPALVRSNEGRPTKIEGNLEHPASLGGSDIFTQASVLNLWDPDRSQFCIYTPTGAATGEMRTWPEFRAAMQAPAAAQRAARGAGLRILTETVTSPTLASFIQSLLATYPEAKWHQWEPLNRSNVWAGARMAFGEIVDSQYRFDQADVIVSLDADFLSSGGSAGFARYTRDWASRRKLDEGGNVPISRMYAIETTFSDTGAKADHRLPVRPSEFQSRVRALATALGVAAGGRTQNAGEANWIRAAAGDLQQHRGRSLVVAGDHCEPVVHALVHAMNAALGNAGKTVVYTDPVEADPVDQLASLRDLVGEMNAGKVEMLLVVGGNPVYTAPADFDFSGALQKVPLRVHLGEYDDETAAQCHWHVPRAHYLEAWGDVRCFDGTVSIVQPLIAPLYDGHSDLEFLTTISTNPVQSAYEVLRAYWRAQHKGADFEVWWRRVVHDGFMIGTAMPAKTVALKPLNLPPEPGPGSQLDVAFRPDPTQYDGRFANNAWLQELPKPLFHLTWDNAMLLSPALAHRLNIGSEQAVAIQYRGRELKGGAWIIPGIPDNTVVLYTGYGRRRGGRAAVGNGYNAFLVRTSDALWQDSGASLAGQDWRWPLADTRDHWNIDSQFGSIVLKRDHVRVATLAEFQKQPDFATAGKEIPPPGIPPEGDGGYSAPESLFPLWPYKGYAWGMAIDLNSCVGCSACVIACQSENNIPVVGKLEVQRGREMHWIRIDRYWSGDMDSPITAFQPVPCMQCENAPCELVCPVQATVHSSEGLNDMIYNRCVGTRYCSNNCPYKVRRFNFFLYADYRTPSYMGGNNPDVTVRSRGVMEKCTYCVQRINRARVQAEKENRTIREDELVPACAQACPADAIVFGDINNKRQRVMQWKSSPRNYAMLAEINTRPRTTYLAGVRNPNPAIEPQEAEA